VIGTLIHSIPVNAQSHSAIVADWDSDGILEIVATHRDGDPAAPNGYIAAYEFDGSEYVEEFRLNSPSKYPKNISVGDVNGDGVNEIVFGTGYSDAGGHVYVVANGGIVWTSPWIGSIRRDTQVSLGDSDQDGEDEIAIAVSWYGRYITLYDHVGSYNFQQVLYVGGVGDGNSSGIGDIDGDGNNEVVYGMGCFSGTNFRTYRYDGSGYVNIWNKKVSNNSCYRSFLEIGDTDNDGADEIVSTFGEVWDAEVLIMEGSQIASWVGPIMPGGRCRSAYPTIGSFFNDGKNQVAFVSGCGSTREYTVFFVEHDGVDYKYAGMLNRDNTVLAERATIGDADNDGKNELVLTEYTDTEYWINVYSYDQPPEEPTVCLYSSDGTTGIEGSTVQYYSAGWQAFGETGPDGCVQKDIEDGQYTFRMGYVGATLDLVQDIAVDPLVVFQTTDVTAELRDSQGQLIDTGMVQYYAGGWKDFGTTSGGQVSKELLPRSYTFRMVYAGATMDVVQDVSADPVVVFQTTNVTIELRDSQGQLMDPGTVQYYAGGWKDFGTTIGGQVSMELLPRSYAFRMRYGGATMDVVQDVSVNPLVVFQTTNVTVELRDSQGQLIDTGVVQYFTSGWKDFGTTDGGQVSMELLPRSYTFRMTYAGATMNIAQDISVNPVVVFQTTNVTVELRDSQGQLMDPGTVQYYAGGWKDFGTTSGGQVSKELLPKSYTFRMYYAGAAVDQAHDVSADPGVTFNTGLVQSESGTCTQYYAGGWQVFLNPIELLPGSYTFRFNDGTPDTVFDILAMEVNVIH
jgi:hypothetical protein